VDRGVRVDQFGNGLSARSEDSVLAWRTATDQLLDFVGDPIATLDPVNVADEAFVMGSVFTTAYRILGGGSASSAAIVEGLARLDQRHDGATEHERAHIGAVRTLVSGEFEMAARQWDDIAIAHPRDLLALKLTHDVCLHIGDDAIRLPSARRAVESAAFDPTERATAVLYANLSFALEEVGEFEEAEHWGRAGLATEPTDLWARHALAHVYEATKRHEDALKLLVPTSGQWTQQTLLANHIWWHVGLRLINHGSVVEALDVLDRELVSTTAFGLADSTSLLWRIELNSAPSAASTRWDSLAAHWSKITRVRLLMSTLRWHSPRNRVPRRTNSGEVLRPAMPLVKRSTMKPSDASSFLLPMRSVPSDKTIWWPPEMRLKPSALRFVALAVATCSATW
jgi:hypothetical protein